MHDVNETEIPDNERLLTKQFKMHIYIYTLTSSSLSLTHLKSL